MKRILLFIILLLSFGLFSKAQESDTIIIDSLLNQVRQFTLSDPDKAMSILDKTSSMSNELNYTKGIAESLNLIGFVYFNWGLNNFALRSFTTALTYFEKINDSIGLSKVYNNLGVVSSTINKYQEALYFFNKSLNIQKNTDNWDNIIDIYNNIGVLYERLEQYERAIQIHRDAMSLSTKHEYILGYSSALNNIGVIYENTTNTDSAIFYYSAAVNYSQDIPNIQLSLMYSNLARTYLSIGELDKCKTALDSGLVHAKAGNFNTYIASIYELYAEYYEESENTEKAYYYLKKHKELNKKLNEQNSEGEFSDFIFSVQRKQWDKEKQLMQEQILLQKRYQFLLILFIIITILVFILLFINIKNRNALLKKKQELSETEALRIAEEMENRNKISFLEKEKLENEILHKERQLTSLTLHLVTKNETLHEINKNLDLVSEKHHIIKQHNSFKKVRSIIKMNSADESIWRSFFFHFEQVYPGFFTALNKKHSKMTSGEEKLCAYIITNLNNKEIAHIFGISEASIKVKKNRLSKKLSLSNASNLSSYLIGFISN